MSEPNDQEVDNLVSKALADRALEQSRKLLPDAALEQEVRLTISRFLHPPTSERWRSTPCAELINRELETRTRNMIRDRLDEYLRDIDAHGVIHNVLAKVLEESGPRLMASLLERAIKQVLSQARVEL